MREVNAKRMAKNIIGKLNPDELLDLQEILETNNKDFYHSITEYCKINFPDEFYQDK